MPLICGKPGIGGDEVAHFLEWVDFAGNAVQGPPFDFNNQQTPVTDNGLTFPNFNDPPNPLLQTNLIFPVPCEFISPSLPKCAVIRPLSDKFGGAMAAAKFLTTHWRAQFANPLNGPEGLEEAAYFVDYQGIRIVSLNSNVKHAEQAEWMRKVLKNHGQKFTLRLLKELASQQNVTLMCHCAEDESHCHRHLLKALLESKL